MHFEVSLYCVWEAKRRVSPELLYSDLWKWGASLSALLHDVELFAKSSGRLEVTDIHTQQKQQLRTGECRRMMKTTWVGLDLIFYYHLMY